MPAEATAMQPDDVVTAHVAHDTRPDPAEGEEQEGWQDPIDLDRHIGSSTLGAYLVSGKYTLYDDRIYGGICLPVEHDDANSDPAVLIVNTQVGPIREAVAAAKASGQLVTHVDTDRYAQCVALVRTMKALERFLEGGNIGPPMAWNPAALEPVAGGARLSLAAANDDNHAHAAGISFTDVVVATPPRQSGLSAFLAGLWG